MMIFTRFYPLYKRTPFDSLFNATRGGCKIWGQIIPTVSIGLFSDCFIDVFRLQRF